MVTDDRYCIDVLTQISAAGRALQEVALGLLDDHVRGCVTNVTRIGPTRPRRSTPNSPTPCAAHCVCSRRRGGLSHWPLLPPTLRRSAVSPEHGRNP
ncbi:metal-sensitive transcriptional regulator [Streptomyces sp. GD-15H]|uniref:metal-sensitive transcriptional regulator n=1 Tax=Streptomyces sp. GD-15H TaxID=3129112 RepID=UPI00324DA744